MAFNLKDIIFNKLFSNFDIREDINKIDGRGLNQRYNEMLGDDLDINLVSRITNLIENTIIPNSAFIRFVPYLETLLGLEKLVDDITIRRKLLSNIISIYKVKGTLISYEILYKSLGFETVELERLNQSFGFDSVVTFDDNIRRYDFGKCFNCVDYDLKLTGDIQITEDLVETIRKAVKIVEPIYANLNNIIYNGLNVENFIIFIDDNGDLIYETNIQTVVLNLDDNGDLLISGASSPRYSLADNGDYIDNFGA